MPHRRILSAVPALVIALLIVSPAANAAAANPASHHAVLRAGQARQPHRMTLPLSRGNRVTGQPLAPAVPSASSPKVVLSGGLNQPGLSIADDAMQNAPPDPTGAIGPDHYVELVNSAIGVYNRSTLALVAKATLNSWLHQSPSAALCDPQIQWDAPSNRWLFSVLKCGANDQGFWFGWSKTSDSSNLSTGWCIFSDSTPNRIADYPKLGHSAGYMMVGANEYNSSNFNFISAAIFWMPTPAAGVTTCSAPTVQQLTGTPTNRVKEGDNVTPAFTPVPVNTMTSAADGYVISAYDPGTATPNKLGVWHLDSSGVLHQEPDISVAAYAYPNPAPNAGGSFPIDTLDGRLTMAVGDPTLGMYTQHTVDSPSGRSVMRWYELTVATPGGAPTLAQEGTISNTTDFVFNGAIAPRLDGHGAAAFYNRSSSTLTPVIAAQIRLSSTAPGAMEPGELQLGASSGNDVDFSCNFTGIGDPCRWGDYSGASPDPSNPQAVWGTNEALGAVNSNNATWFTRNWSVLVAVLPHTPTGVTAAAGDGSATVSWTPSPFDAGTPDTGYTVRAYVGVTQVATQVVGAGVTSTTFAGLANGTTYTFTVTATNLVGDSPESAHSNPVTPERRSIGGAPPVSPSPSRPPIAQVSPPANPTPRP